MTNWLRDAEPAPALLVFPEEGQRGAIDLDEAHAAIEFWEYYSGKTLDATQRLYVEIAMAQDQEGFWACRTTGREMSRQNGKGDEIEVVEFWGLVQLSEAIAHTVHEAVVLTTQAQQRMLSLFEHRDLRHLIEGPGSKVWKGVGQQMIQLSTGGVIWYRTRSAGGLRGVDDISRLVIDEAQEATDEQLQAMTSILMANPNPQINALGTAGLSGRSEWWWWVRKRALKALRDGGGNGQFGYLGHTAEVVVLNEDDEIEQEPVDIYDDDLVVSVNPAVFNGRGQGIEFLREERENLSPDAFAQEHMCVWAAPPVAESDRKPIRSKDWSAIETEELPVAKSIRLGVDAPPSRTSVEVALSGLHEDGTSHVQMRYHISPKELAQRGKLAKLIAEMCDFHKLDTIVVPPRSPFLAWRQEFAKPIEIMVMSEDGKLRKKSVTVGIDELSSAEFVDACGQMEVAAATHTMAQRPSPELTKAVQGLVSKPSGDVTVWTRKGATVNISPIVACAAAAYRVPEPGEVPDEWFAFSR